MIRNSFCPKAMLGRRNRKAKRLGRNLQRMYSRVENSLDPTITFLLLGRGMLFLVLLP